jgi:hypothetical protein
MAFVTATTPGLKSIRPLHLAISIAFRLTVPGSQSLPSKSFHGEFLTHGYISMYCGSMPRAATTSDVFNAVGDASRRSLLDALATGDATVGELVDRLELPQPVVSKHLRVLRDVGLVRCRTHGRHRTYRVDPAA